MHKTASLALSLALLTLFTLACGGQGGAKSAATVEASHAMDDQVMVETFAVTVTDERQRQSVGNKLISHEAPDGSALQLVELTVRNDHTDAVNLVGRFSLRDDEDRTYAPTPECQFALGASGLSGLKQLNPAQEESGEVCFQVPDDASGLQFGFKGALLKPPVWFDL
ncbi:MAG: DUF4352 domain-containing protein [Proteobacteria bacterium]|nr:DUF4352 domain-containing protein [Pseudomonadota bacterium]